MRSEEMFPVVIVTDSIRHHGIKIEPEIAPDVNKSAFEQRRFSPGNISKMVKVIPRFLNRHGITTKQLNYPDTFKRWIENRITLRE
jgi:hypothetical protein